MGNRKKLPTEIFRKNVFSISTCIWKIKQFRQCSSFFLTFLFCFGHVQGSTRKMIVFRRNHRKKVETLSTFLRREKFLAKWELCRMRMCKRLFLRKFFVFPTIFFKWKRGFSVIGNERFCNPFHAAALFPYPLKLSENQIFQGDIQREQ